MIFATTEILVEFYIVNNVGIMSDLIDLKWHFFGLAAFFSPIAFISNPNEAFQCAPADYFVIRKSSPELDRGKFNVNPNWYWNFEQKMSTV